MNAPLDLNPNDELEVITLTRPTRNPVQIIPTRIIQAPPDTRRANQQILEYIDLINIIGYVGGPCHKSVMNIPELRPFPSIYFIYKRFFRQRKKVERWLINEETEFTRPGREHLDQRAFREWLKSEERNLLQKKIIEDNKRIEASMGNLIDKLMACSQNNAHITNLYPLSHTNDKEETVFAIEEGLRVVYKLLEPEEDPSDDSIRHMINLLDGLFIMSELEGKLVRAVDSNLRKRGVEDLHEYFIEQEAKVPMLRMVYNLA